MNVKCLMAVAMTLAVGSAFAQVKVSSSSGTTETMNKVKPGMAINAADRKFFAEARVATVFNMRLAEIARNRANSSWAKEFSELRHKDYAQNYGELKVIGSKVGIKVDKSLPGEWESRLSQIKSKSGSGFDNTFSKNYVAVNEQFSDQAERAVKSGNNSLIRNFAVTQGPVIRLNIKMAKRKVSKI